MIPERRLYQNNFTGYLLILLYIAICAAHSIFLLNAMEINENLGVIVMLTIVLLLLGFLAAVKVRVYSLGWSYGAIAIGVFQFVRLFFNTGDLSGSPFLIVSILLISSASACITGGVVSAIACKKRDRSLHGGEVTS